MMKLMIAAAIFSVSVPVYAELEKGHIVGSYDVSGCGTMVCSFTTDAGVEFNFDPNSKDANKIYKKCKSNEHCGIEGTFETKPGDEFIMKVTKVIKMK